MKKFMHSGQPGPSSDSPAHISDFELRALAFADLIERITSGETASPPPPSPQEPSNDLPLFSSIRCICGENENVTELIQCHDCHCFLHRRCMDKLYPRSSTFRCPFCALQLDGVDPFREVRGFIDSILTELKTLHGLVSEAASTERQISGMEYGMVQPPMIRGQRQTGPQLRTTLIRVMQEISQHTAALANQ
jgi:hypothetical protein